MGRVFRLKHMKIVSALMAGAVLAGSMNIDMLCVQAAQENPAAVMEMMETGNTAADDSGDGGDDASKGSDINRADESEGAVNDNDTAVRPAADLTDDDTDSEQQESADDEASAEITDGFIADHVYDGEQMTIDQLLPTGIGVEWETSDGAAPSIDEAQCDYYYLFSGSTAEGTKYDPGVDGPLSEEELKESVDFVGPKDAGTYTCTVSYAEKRSAGAELEKIYGTTDISFQITKKPITIKANDITIKVGDEVPKTAQYTYSYVGSGLASGDSLTTEPEITCDVTNTDTPADYEISISGADAGANYEISYQKGTLKIEEDDEEDDDKTSRKLVRINTPDPVTDVQNGTSLAEIVLPESVTIVTTTGGSAAETTETAQVKWDRENFAEGTSYDPDDAAEQTFRLQGTVTLPEGVDADGVDLTVTISITVSAKSEVPKRYKLVRIVTPGAVRNVTNGTALANIALPETVSIVIQNIETQANLATTETVAVEVEWDRSKTVDGTSYRESYEDAEQSFRLRGTVQLPEMVDANDVSLFVTIQIYVREKITSNNSVAVPTASIESGNTIQRGTTVELFCSTEGAVIYYTLDGSEPTRQSNRYTKPIALNVFTTIRAFAVMTGHPDSAVAKFTYSVITGTTGGSGQDESEVPKEDIPTDGKIPEGMWVTTVEQYVYTGKAIKPEVRVYDHTTLLVEKKDYTISYKNNVNAASADAQKAPTITITGKGNYEGKLIKTFTIARKNINDADVSIDDITLLYNKKAQKPSPTVIWNGKKLTNKKDYTVQDVSYTDAGNRRITVTGNGNYQGERKINFTIVADGVLVSKLTVAKIPNQVYTGKEIKPQLTVKEKNNVLGLNQNYTVTYENNIQVGTATAIIKGNGRYVGTKKVTFKIVPVATLTKARIDVQFNSQPVYTGREIRADGETVTISIKDENGQNVTRTLERNIDYTVAYQNNIKAGKAAVIFTGIGAYSGTVKKTFKIDTCDISSNKVRVNVNKSYVYMKGGSKAEPIVMFGGAQLKLGTDYTLSYKKNAAAGNEATVTIKGRGNFKGSTAATYMVTAQELENMKISAADKVYQNKKNVYKTTVRLTDTNGKALSAGKDYDKNFEYVYAADTKVYNAQLNQNNPEKEVQRKAGEMIDKDDVIPAGTAIRVTVIAKGADYTGRISGTYRIVAASIASAKVSVPVQTYTGKEIEPPKSQITVTLRGEVLSEGQYEILEYTNNVNKGTAKMVIHGINGYGGTKTVNFKIKGKGIFGL